MPSIHRTKKVNYTPEQMYELVNHIEAYPEFLPWCSHSEVLSRDEDMIQASITVGGAGLQKTFTTINRLQRNKMIEIRLGNGPFEHLEGFWLFQPLENNACEVCVDLEFEFSGKLLELTFGPVFHRVANSLVEAFSKRAEVVYGKN